MVGRGDQQIGKRIRKLRSLRGWSQAVLAEAAELTVEGVSRIERGVRVPRIATLRALAAALDAPISSLLGEPPADQGVAEGLISADLLAVIEPLLDQPGSVRATAARIVRSLVG
jgi:transcriptional regulator with XRE-family HTH domain